MDIFHWFGNAVMGTKMRNERIKTNESIDFTCPCCGACAFEIVDTDRLSSDTEDNGADGVIVMKCLNCLELYRYRLGSETAADVLLRAQ